jgi:hypothetical protein
MIRAKVVATENRSPNWSSRCMGTSFKSRADSPEGSPALARADESCISEISEGLLPVAVYIERLRHRLAECTTKFLCSMDPLTTVCAGWSAGASFEKLGFSAEDGTANQPHGTAMSEG